MIRGSRRRDAVALLGALVVVTALIWIVREIRTSDNRADTADEYAAYLAATALVVSLLAALVAWWRKDRATLTVRTDAEQVAAAADQLAQRMLESWRQEAAERQISTPAPVRVQWRWGPAEVTPPPTEVITAPVAGTAPRPLPEPNPAPKPDGTASGVLLETGVVTQLHDEVYRRLPHGRLVLVGGPGAGKTGAMILLLLAALEHRLGVPETQRGEVPVPVWLTLGGWDPATQSLHQWATATMNRDHPYLRAADYGSDAAGELLRTARVALFLDGLDEMATTVQSKALDRIEREGAGLRIVLSSRPDEYRQAINEQRLHNTAVIEVQPVDSPTASAYLQHGHLGAQRDRWAQVGDHLTQNPESVAARTLNNPLTLSLTRLIYQNQDPTPLTDPAQFSTVVALRRHLVDRILVAAYPDERHRAHATRWLAWIAHHLGPERDLAWWHIPRWIPRWQLALAFGFSVGLGLGLSAGLANGLADGLTVGLASGLMLGLVQRFGKEPKVIIPRWPRPYELSRPLTAGLLFGILFGLLVGLTLGLTLGSTAGLAGGLATGLTLGLVFVLSDLWTLPVPSAVASTPLSTYRADRRTYSLFGLAYGVAFGPALVLVGGLTGKLTGGLAGGLAAALVAGLTVGSMPMVGLSQLLLVMTGAGRVHFMRVLEEARHRQVLRQAGAVYQFRHAELQEHLAAIHCRATNPSAST